jgi:hypothetical protein
MAALTFPERPGPRGRGEGRPRAIVRLDLLNPRTTPPANSGTDGGPGGVTPGVGPEVGPAEASIRRVRPASWVLVTLLALGLLGQGEVFRLDPRFRSPSTTLLSYWRALRDGDSGGALECFSEMRDDQPMPGALWFLPQTDELWLDGFRSLPVTSGRVLVTYEVHFRPSGSGEERMFHTGSELVRMRGEWRIAKPIGEASMPEWKPVPGPVDM